ncbi:MAG: glycosyltransferase family 2 protein [Pelagibacteraceae bacterium]
MKKFIILIPVYNDWQSVFKLIEKIDEQINNETVDVIIVNDASTDTSENNKNNYLKLHSVKIINLKINGGHRKAIATGLKYCKENLEFDYIIPMDGDGEDRPEELVDFFNKVQNSSSEVTVGIRVKRSEGILFKFLYAVHKIFTQIITGKVIRFGNYSCLSKSAVEKLLSSGSLWLSFSGSVAKNFPKFETIQSIRGSRYFGPSKMSLFKLLLHSFRISSVFKVAVFLRMSLFIFLFLFLTYSLSLNFIGFVLAGLIVLILVIYLSVDDDINKLNNSLENIKDLTNIYSR